MGFCNSQEYLTYLALLELVMCNTSSVGHDMRESAILPLRSDEVLSKQQYCAQQAALLIFLDLFGHQLC